MHEKKAEVLAKLEEASRGIDDALGHMANVALHPGEHGWSHSISAAVIGLPIVALSALAVDVGEIMVKRTSDAEWNRDFPPDKTGDASAPPKEQR